MKSAWYQCRPCKLVNIQHVRVLFIITMRCIHIPGGCCFRLFDKVYESANLVNRVIYTHAGVLWLSECRVYPYLLNVDPVPLEEMP